MKFKHNGRNNIELGIKGAQFCLLSISQIRLSESEALGILLKCRFPKSGQTH